jgi:hypothetical protein
MSKPGRSSRGSARPSRAGLKRLVERIAEDAHELKYHWVSNSTTASYDNPLIVALADITQGDSDGTRDGDSIRPLRIHGSVLVIAGNTADVWARVLIVQWRGSSTAPTLASFLPPSGGTADSGTVATPYNHDQASQVTYLFDSGPRYISGTSSGTGVKAIPLNVDIDLRRFRNRKGFMQRLQYLGGSSTSHFGAYYMIALSSVTDASGNDPVVTSNLVLDYHDE